MDFSAANTGAWNAIIQFGIIAVSILVSNLLCRRVGFIKKALMPTAVLAGFLLLIAKTIGLINLNLDTLEMITYHGIAIGFIAMSLRIPSENEKGGGLVAMKSGAVIVSSYMIQGFIGLVISIVLSFTLMPDLFVASGVLLPLGYGQGPGQANNMGATYEALGFAGGRSFGLAIAAAGYLCACTVGVIYTAILVKRGKIAKGAPEFKKGSVTVDTFQDEGEVPISESIDRLSIQIMMILGIYLATYLATWGITSGISAIAPGLGKTVNSLLWGFNFIIGSAFATLVRVILKKTRDAKLMTHQYQNNYLLSRISGLAFDVMIVAGIASIEFDQLKGLWLPFILMAVAGAIITLLHLRMVCKWVYPSYYSEGLMSMYGMMTGTISSGVLLLRELDPELKTPAANNLVLGSSFGILFGAPLLVLAGIAPKSRTLAIITAAIALVYYFILLGITRIKGKKNKK